MTPIRFAAVGLNHGHIHSMTRTLIDAGAQCAAVYAAEPQLLAEFAKAFPQVPAADCFERILADDSIQLIASAAIPCHRATLAIQAMRHGKDVILDKPGATTLEQLQQMRQVAAQTKRLCIIFYGERLEGRAAQRACELVKAGAIGKPVHTTGFGPHTMRPAGRPSWFFKRQEYGGILTDIASHQFDFFLHISGSTKAQVISARVANVANPSTPSSRT